MKSGKTLQTLAVEIERQSKTKRDFVADTRKLIMSGGQELDILGVGGFPLTEIAHEQIANRIGVPQKYYERLRHEAPALLDENVNYWMKNKPEKRLVRTLDNSARAFLSDRYRPLDNFELMENVLPKLQKTDLRVESCEVTERRLYIKAFTPRITANVKKGDTVQAGLIISNSEIGCGSVRIEPMILRLVCMNGAVMNDSALRQFHVGKGNGEADGVQEFFRDSTRRAADKAFWMKVRDIIDATLDHVLFQKMVDRMKDATKEGIDGDIPEVVERAGNRLGLSDKETGSVLSHLIREGDLSKYGLFNAVTRAAQDVESYDRSTEMERIGWGVIELAPRDWETISGKN